ncbi:MAG: hypothetical protein AABX29_05460 [Nanoarchaeota archaeon]
MVKYNPYRFIDDSAAEKVYGLTHASPPAPKADLEKEADKWFITDVKQLDDLNVLE